MKSIILIIFLFCCGFCYSQEYKILSSERCFKTKKVEEFNQKKYIGFIKMTIQDRHTAFLTIRDSVSKYFDTLEFKMSGGSADMKNLYGFSKGHLFLYKTVIEYDESTNETQVLLINDKVYYFWEIKQLKQ